MSRYRNIHKVKKYFIDYKSTNASSLFALTIEKDGLSLEKSEELSGYEIARIISCASSHSGKESVILSRTFKASSFLPSFS